MDAASIGPASNYTASGELKETYEMGYLMAIGLVDPTTMRHLEGCTATIHSSASIRLSTRWALIFNTKSQHLGHTL